MRSKLEELRRLNNILDEQINEDNQPIFTDMICYIRSADISELNQEMVRRDLSEMILSAQSRGDSIRDVIGEDFKGFCDEVILNLPPKTTKEKWIDRLDIVCFCVSILGGINIVFSQGFLKIISNIISKQAINYNIDISVGTMISIVVIIALSFLIVNRITKNALNQGGTLNMKEKVMAAMAVGTALTVLIIISLKFGRQTLVSVNIFLAIAVIGGFYAAHKVLSGIKKY